MSDHDTAPRSVGLLEATGIGVGAIVGGGILALAGISFAVTGPSAILAFALNGVIAFLTAASFAEVCSKFPESGGAYAFAKRVLSIESAFGVGWIVWFASIVASVLYAFGFGQFSVIIVGELFQAAFGSTPEWLVGRTGICFCALLATGGYTLLLLRQNAGGGAWANIGKLCRCLSRRCGISAQCCTRHNVAH